MKKLALLLIIILLPGFSYPASGERFSPDVGVTSPISREKVSLDEASALIAELRPRPKLQIEEITTDTLWREMGIQLFANTCEHPYEYVYAVSGNTALELKDAWGAYYFDYALADMDQDGIMEMLYVYDWGSGIIRSIIGVLRVDMNQPKVMITRKTKGFWSIQNLAVKDNAVTFDMWLFGGTGEKVRGICRYGEGQYIFDVAK